MSGLKIGVIGATGMVGRQYLQILEASPLEIAQLRLYASARSVGSRMTFAGESWPVEEFTVEACRGLVDPRRERRCPGHAGLRG